PRRNRNRLADFGIFSSQVGYSRLGWPSPFATPPDQVGGRTSGKRLYPRRLSRNTACSPNKFQNHHGIFNRIRRPQALSAAACSILAPATKQSWRKSLMLQKWMLGVSYQA